MVVTSEDGNPKAKEVNQHQAACKRQHSQPFAERCNKLFIYMFVNIYLFFF